MFYRYPFPRDLMAHLNRLQRDLHAPGDNTASIRGAGRGGFPALNVAGTPQSVEIFAFAPGLDPATIDVQLDKGVLTLTGERPSVLPPAEANATTHIDERFAGRFRRVVNLPEDIDPNGVSARYKHGVLHITVPRSVATQTRRIPVL